jgi:signal transduction histidine kinase
VDPFVHQTWWFKVLCLLAGVLTLVSISRFRRRVRESRQHAVEEERGRIARDLHDTLAQGFAGLGFQLERLSRRSVEPAQTAIVNDAQTLLAHCRLESRFALAGMRIQTGGSQGVADALKEIVRQSELFTDAAIQLQASPCSLQATSSQGAAMVRVAQEAILNAVLHGKASTVVLTLTEVNGHVMLEVADDGEGVPQQPEPNGMHFGILGMRERAAAVGAVVSIEGRAEGGTRVTFAIPKVQT